MKHWLSLFAALAVCIASLGSAAAAEDHPALEAKVKRYWAAEVGQDYGTVYDLLTPEDQSVIARDDFIELRKNGGPPRFVAAQVGEIVYSGDVAWVHVKFDWMFPKHPQAGSRPGGTWHLWRNAGGWGVIAPNRRDQWPILPPTLRPAAEEAVVAERVRGLWEAKAKEDWKSAYTYMPPWFRERTSLEKFLQSKARFLYVSPVVEWVEADGNEARASIKVGTKLNDPAASKMQPRVGNVIEPWFKEGGVWYVKAPPPDEPDSPAAEKSAVSSGARR